MRKRFAAVFPAPDVLGITNANRKYFCSMTDFKTRVLRLKPEVQILGSLKIIFFHTKVEVLHLKSYFLRNKETKLNANLWKAFSTELFCRRSWCFHVVLLNDLHLARKPRKEIWEWLFQLVIPFFGRNKYEEWLEKQNKWRLGSLGMLYLGNQKC